MAKTITEREALIYLYNLIGQELTHGNTHVLLAENPHDAWSTEDQDFIIALAERIGQQMYKKSDALAAKPPTKAQKNATPRAPEPPYPQQTEEEKAKDHAIMERINQINAQRKAARAAQDD